MCYLSTKDSVSKVKKAKKKGLQISADVCLHNLILTDEQIIHFDTRYKTLPPLRNRKDCVALIKGLKDGTIDVICTDHSPEDEENKKTEFNNICKLPPLAATILSTPETVFWNPFFTDSWILVTVKNKDIDADKVKMINIYN